MKTRWLWLIALSLVFTGLGPIYAQGEVVNLLPNGDFETGNAGPWNIYGNITFEVVTDCVGAAVPEGPIEGNHCLHLVITKATGGPHESGMSDGSFVFEKGKKYTFSCFLKCKSGTFQFRMKPEHAADPWEAYGDQVFVATEEWQEFYVTTPVFTQNVTPASPSFHLGFVVGEIWIDDLKLYLGDYVPTQVEPGTAAMNPSPEDGAVDAPRDAVLRWEPGVSADKHNVYFGTSLADVEKGDASVLVSPGQTETTYAPEGLLEFGQTYYWRVDEINAPPDSSVFAGPVWSFTVEPYTYPIRNVTATASSSSTVKGMTPDKTVDGSGLTGDAHSTDATAMWLSGSLAALPAWIQYEFDDIYILSELWVWNANQAIEDFIGFGAKDVTIEYSLDGVEWTSLGDVQFSQAPGAAGYTSNTTVDMAGVQAKFVRLTIHNNWGGMASQTGLSEVRFYYIPAKSRQPEPASGEAGVPLDVVLTWRGGRQVVSHDVYLSTNKKAVADRAALVDTVSENRYQPGTLEFGQSYYWRIDEVNEATSPAVREGDIWNFTTTEYAVIDDFEGYTDNSPDCLFQTWTDGFGYTEPENVPGNGTGSTVGHLQAPFAEKYIVYSGSQAMPMQYDNAVAPFYSEAERTWDTSQDWTRNAADTLWVHFCGDADNDASPLYVAIQDSLGHIGVVTHTDPNAVLADQYRQWAIPLDAFASAGVNLTSVRKMMIGVGDRDNPISDGTGTIYIDDIRFGRPATGGLAANLLVNGGFEDGVLAPWYVYDNTGGGATAEVVTDDPIEGNSCLHMVVPAVTESFWDIGLVNPGYVFEAGKKYTASAWLKCASGTLDVNFKPELGAAPYSGYGERVITMTEEWAEYSVTTPVFTEDTSPANITFHTGFAPGEFWVDDVRFYEGDYVPAQ
jgi:hypothetical protein